MPSTDRPSDQEASVGATVGTGSGPLVGKLCVVTGATSGLGEWTALGLARLGGTVVIVGRDPVRCAATLTKIGAELPQASLRAEIADLSRMDEVRKLAETLRGQETKIDVLVNNAGGVFLHRQLTSEGNELTLALNVLAPFLLTRLLQPTLQVGQPSRVVNVASAAHAGARLDFDDLDGARRYDGFGVYGRSKLALILLTHEFARRWAGTGVTINSVHPGFVRTRFGHNNPGVGGFMISLGEVLFAISPKRGSDTIVFAASAPEVESASGSYFVRRKPRRSSKASYDEAASQRLWEIASQRTGLPA